MITRSGSPFFLIVVLMSALSVNAQTNEITQPTPPGKLVDIGGWKLHINGQGPADDKVPTVIFENGIRGFSFDWAFVQPKVASFAKTYTYDRSGSTWSELGPRPHTLHQSVYNLHMLLQKANISPPYIFAGASLGGLLARLYAQQYPDEVVGMVLLDAGHENGIHYINGKKLRPATDASEKPIPPVISTATEEDNNLARSPEAINAIGSALKPIGYPFTKIDAPFQKLPDSVQKLRLWALNQFEFYAANDNSFIMEEKAAMIREREKQKYMLGDMPLIVLTAQKSGEPDADEKDRLLNQAGLTELSRNSKQIIARESSHEIHIDQPELVIEAIKQVVDAVSKKEPLKK